MDQNEPAYTATPEWRALLTGFTDSAFRLETLQHYTEPEEADAFARFRAGRDPGLDLSWWCNLVAGHRSAGRTMSRVRIILEPPTDYTRFELYAYPTMADAGDDIRVISTPRGAWPSKLPHHDFWIFDGRVWILNYDDAGTLRGAELVTDPDTIADHLHWRDLAMSRAVPVRDYLNRTRRRAS